MEQDDEFIKEIAPDVLKVLARKRFFEALDDQMCPSDRTQQAVSCQGTYSISTAILVRFGFDQEEIKEIARVLAARGGFCDCEILYNVAEESCLKLRYWKARATGTTPGDSEFHHR